MPLITYEAKTFPDWKVAIVEQAVEIANDYASRGLDLTLRQLYYRFIAGHYDLLPEKWIDPKTGSKNNERSYKNLGVLLGEARMAGLMDWRAMIDRTRQRSGNPHWDSPTDIIAAIAQQYRLDLWDGQKYRPEVWVEKDALEGVVARAANQLDIPYFSCRGYTSLSSIWDCAQVLATHAKNGRTPVILHLGDHDPSGMDMSRDIEDRVRLFMGKFGSKLKFERIALNKDQIEQYDPPPNPVKATDSRSDGYTESHGDECWELDALDPDVLDQIIKDAVLPFRNDALYKARLAQQKKEKALLQATSDHWIDVAARMELYVEDDEQEDDEP
jgi:hypothetical protein